MTSETHIIILKTVLFLFSFQSQWYNIGTVSDNDSVTNRRQAMLYTIYGIAFWHIYWSPVLDKLRDYKQHTEDINISAKYGFPFCLRSA